MMRAKAIFMQILLIALILSGCTSNTTSLNNSGNSGETVKPNEQKDQTEKPDQNNQLLLSYFLPDGSKAKFKGEGNEFAQLNIDVAHPYEDYVILHEDNGGALIRRIFKIENDKVLKMEDKMIDMNEDFPSLQEIQAMKPVGIYLKKPIEVGTSFDGWEIVETDITVETPYDTFNHAFVIEEKGNDYVNRKYLVEGFGEVKRESIMKMDNGDEDYIVTSTLESVTKPE